MTDRADFPGDSPTSSFSSKPSNPAEWASFWIEVTRKCCLKKGMTKDRSHICTEKLRSFFMENKCHPRKITPDTIRDFLSTVYYNDRHIFEDVFAALESLYELFTFKYPKETLHQQNAIQNFMVPETDQLTGRLLTELKLKEASHSTRKIYCREVSKYLDYLNRAPTPDDRPAIESYLLMLRNERKLSPRTINLVAAAIAALYKMVLHSEIAVKDIPRMKPGKDLPKVYGQGDVGKLIDCIENVKHRLVVMFVYGCGMRLAEVRVLKLSDIDFDRKVIRINGKGSKQRDVPLDPCLATPLQSYLAIHSQQTYLFEGRQKGKPYPPRTIQKIYENACRKSAINRKGGIHSLRHSYATHLHEQGVDINKIKTLLGHSSVKTTQIYTHVSKAEIAKIRSPLATLPSSHVSDIDREHK